MTDSEENDDTEPEVLTNPFDVADTEMIANSKTKSDDNFERIVKDTDKTEESGEEE